MNHSLPRQHPKLFFLVIYFCLWCLAGFWTETHALAEENGAASSRVNIKEGRISVSAKDVPLELLCKDIESKSGIRFRIQDAVLGDKLSIELKDLPLLKGLRRLLLRVNYMLCFDERNKLSEVFIVGQAAPYTPPVLRKPPSRREIPSFRRTLNRLRP